MDGVSGAQKDLTLAASVQEAAADGGLVSKRHRPGYVLLRHVRPLGPSLSGQL